MFASFVENTYQAHTHTRSRTHTHTHTLTHPHTHTHTHTHTCTRTTVTLSKMHFKITKVLTRHNITYIETLFTYKNCGAAIDVNKTITDVEKNNSTSVNDSRETGEESSIGCFIEDGS